MVCSGSVSLSVSLKVHLLSHITCREQVLLLSCCVMSAVMTMKWFYVWKIYARNTIINRVTDTFFDFALGEPKVAMTQAMYVSNNVLLS